MGAPCPDPGSWVHTSQADTEALSTAASVQRVVTALERELHIYTMLCELFNLTVCPGLLSGPRLSSRLRIWNFLEVWASKWLVTFTFVNRLIYYITPSLKIPKKYGHRVHYSFRLGKVKQTINRIQQKFKVSTTSINLKELAKIS